MFNIKLDDLLPAVVRGPELFEEKYPAPALVFEPIDMNAISRGTREQRPLTKVIKMADTTGKVPTLQAMERQPEADIHPDSTVAWLVKTERNPFGFITLGRARNNDIILLHATLSKVHLLFHEMGPEWHVEDNNSTNGTMLDLERIEPKKKYRLHDGLRMVIGAGFGATFLRPDSLFSLCCLRDRTR